MPIDPAAVALIEILDQTFPKVETAASAAEARQLAKDLPRLPDIEPVGDVEDRTIPGPDGEIPVRIYKPKGAAESRPGVVYFHGGGWVICDLDSHDGGCRRLTNAVDAVVVSVDYRLAPEHRWPAAADDAYAASQWVADHARELGIDPARLAVAGDSAGGNLTAVVAQMARDRDGPNFAFQLLVYPVTDVSATRHDYPSKRENAAGFFLTTASMEWYRDQYLDESAQGEDPYVSPIRATSLAGLPPACVVTAEMDPLRDEGEAYAAALEAAGVPVTTYRAPGMFHGFFNMDAVLDGSKLAQQAAFDAMRAALHGTS
jgi:acetyl esterase/lipase